MTLHVGAGSLTHDRLVKLQEGLQDIGEVDHLLTRIWSQCSKFMWHGASRRTLQLPLPARLIGGSDVSCGVAWRHTMTSTRKIPKTLLTLFCSTE